MAKNGPERAKNDCLGSKNGEKGDMDLASTLSPSPPIMDQIHKVLFDGLLKGGLRTEDQFMKLKTSDIENITIQNDKNFSLSRLEFEIWIKKIPDGAWWGDNCLGDQGGESGNVSW